MEQYEATIASIDNALNRLNLTLASYRRSRPVGDTQKSISPNASALADAREQDHEQSGKLEKQDVPDGRREDDDDDNDDNDDGRHSILSDESDRYVPDDADAQSAGDHFRGKHKASIVEHLLPGDVSPWSRLLVLETAKPLQRTTEFRDYGDEDQEELAKEVLHAVRTMRSDRSLPLSLNRSTKGKLARRESTRRCCEDDPYNVPLYILQAVQYEDLDYPDLAAGAAYKALLLADAFDDDAEDYHEQVKESLRYTMFLKSPEERREVFQTALDDGTIVPDDGETMAWIHYHYLPIIYRLLTRSLIACGCFRSADLYSTRAIEIWRDDKELASIRDAMYKQLRAKLGGTRASLRKISAEWPDQGYVRREEYPWNTSDKPARYSAEHLQEINRRMRQVSSGLEVRTVELPNLAGEAGANVQLGVFATQDLQPGQVILDERSILTATNRLQDALCDACSADLPALDDPATADVRACPACEVVFCSTACHDLAMARYHPALCGYDVEAMARDVPPAEAADALYLLLLLRVLAISWHLDAPALTLPEVDTCWGDFVDYAPRVRDALQTDCLTTDALPRTLPFSFERHVRLPLTMLEKIGVDVFAAHGRFDVWHFNVLYAKFRGTASARLSGSASRGGRARGPEVGAVHPMWCLANHSCAPNVRWEWGGTVQFTVREEPIVYRGRRGATTGIKKGEEVLNHYCDINLPVDQRREWARGALGGECRCLRCQWESSEPSKLVGTEEKAS